MSALRVLSHQLSGVAWVPWRIGRCIEAAGDEIEYLTTGSEQSGMEAYGLPSLQSFGRLGDLLRCHQPDIVHLHHDVAAQALIPFIRNELPKARIVITLHGEPDRSRNRVGVNRPDAYHVVEPGLLGIKGVGSLLGSRWIQNHPGFNATPTPQGARERVIYLPWSHARTFKDWDALDAEEEPLRAAGWTIERESTIRPNSTVTQRLARVAAVWVQRRGYLDLLTMEAMMLGALPIVELNDERWDQWTGALGFEPSLVSGWSRGGLAELVDRMSGLAGADINRRGMAQAWTMAACGNKWVEFFRSLTA